MSGRQTFGAPVVSPGSTVVSTTGSSGVLSRDERVVSLEEVNGPLQLVRDVSLYFDNYYS